MPISGVQSFAPRLRQSCLAALLLSPDAGTGQTSNNNDNNNNNDDMNDNNDTSINSDNADSNNTNCNNRNIQRALGPSGTQSLSRQQL